jgi:hypothetical protein
VTEATPTSAPTTQFDDLSKAEEFVFDYSRVGRRQLVAMAVHRGLLGSGTNPQLIERLRDWDHAHPDATDAERFPPEPGQESSQEPARQPERPAAETPAAGGADADQDEQDDEQDDETPTTSEPPAAGAPAAPAAGPTMFGGILRGGLTDPGPMPTTATAGVVEAGRTPTAVARMFRAEFPLGDRSIDDAHHLRLIEETHRLANEAGYQTRGGLTVGHRVGFSSNERGRTVIYEVHLKREPREQ